MATVAPPPCQASPARCLSCLGAVPPAQSTPSSTRSGRDAPRHLSPSQSGVLSILLPAECTTSSLFQDLTLALCVHCTESSLKMARFPPVPTRSPLSHRRDELVVRSSSATTRDSQFTRHKIISMSPHAPAPCIHAQVEGDKAIYFSLPGKQASKTDGRRSKAPAEPLQSHGATARPCRCHFVTSPGWFVVMNQHFPSSKQCDASPKYMKGKKRTFAGRGRETKPARAAQSYLWLSLS